MNISADKHSLEEHTDALADFLPSGPLFEAKKISDSNFRKLLKGFAGELFTAEGYIKTFDDEYSPLTTVLFIEEWERALGIPDDCFRATGDIDERRVHILTKLASLGIQTQDDFIALGLIFGNDITVEALDAMVSPPIPVTYPDARFTLVITGAEIVSGFPPYDVPFTPDTGESILQCLFNKLIPVNCKLLFVNKLTLKAIIEPLDYVSSNTIYADQAFEVDWGDGIFISYPAGNASAIASGTITVNSIDTVTHCKFLTDTFTDINILRSSTLTSLALSFTGLTNLVTFDIDDTSNVTNFQGAWSTCTGLTSFPSIDTSQGTVFTGTWGACTGLTSLPAIDTSQGTTFFGTFSGCTNLVCLSSLNTTNSINSFGLFTNCVSLVAPTPAEQTALANAPIGLNYVNPGSCP
jgi:uncharacterized protein YmfQ (DUF2313 family)